MDDRLTQATVAAHLGVAQPHVGEILAAIGCSLTDDLGTIRTKYLIYLRERASGRFSTEREAYLRIRRQRAELELRKRAGELCLANDVEAVASNLAREVREALLDCPARLAAELQSTKTQHEREVVIDRHMRRLLETLRMFCERGAASLPPRQ